MSKELKELALKFLELSRKQGNKDYEPYEYFLKPCQILIIFLKREHLIFIITKHTADLPDKEIEFYETKNFKSLKKLVEEKILTKPCWKKEYSQIFLAHLFADFYEDYKKIKTEIKKKKVEYSCLNPQFEGKISGYILAEVEPSLTKAEDIENHLKKQNKKLEDEHFHLFEEFHNEYEYMDIAFWYPPIIFEDYPLTLTQKILFDTNYKGQRIFFTNTSQIGIRIPVKPPLNVFDDKALECLNEIVGTATICGIDCIKITSNSLHTLVFTKNFEKMVGHGGCATLNLENYLMDETFEGIAKFYLLQLSEPFKRVSKTKFEDLIQKAEKIMKNEDIKNYISLYLDAKSHLLKQEMKTSFLLSWIVIEKYIDDVWEHYLSRQNLTKKRNDKLTKSMLWTADDKLETLNLLGEISNEKYLELARLKKIRNKIVHDERTVTHREAEECNTLTIKIIRQLIRERCYIEIS